MMDPRRKVLADYLDQKVLIRGMFERMTVNKNPAKPFKVALLQDVEVELAKAKYDLGHIWIQHAEPFADLHHGDRIQCFCRVWQYKKNVAIPNQNGASLGTDYSLGWPTDIKLIGRPIALATAHETANASPAPAPTPAPPAEPARAPDPVQFILQVKDMVQKVGGCERIVELKALMDKVGGWEGIQGIHQLAEDMGGWDRLEQLLALLKL